MAILTGIISGIATSFGLGGGSLLILILVNFMGIDQHIAQATNLIFFIPTAIVASIINFKQKIINKKIATIVIIVGVIGAIIGANISLKIESTNLKKFFGIFLIILAFFEIYNIVKQYKKGKKTNNTIDKK